MKGSVNMLFLQIVQFVMLGGAAMFLLWAVARTLKDIRVEREQAIRHAKQMQQDREFYEELKRAEQ